MSRLTVTEKDHWKSRIEKRINKAIDALETHDVNLMPYIRAKAELAAYKALGTAQLHTKIEEIKSQQQSLSQELDELEKQLFSKVLGADAANKRSTYQLRSSFEEKLQRVRSQFEETFLEESPIGQDILKLQAEKESLLDTVWLATSGAQIRELWSRVALVVGDETTPLQQQILETEV